MSPRRFAARRGAQDANQPAIVAALRRCGASVVDLHAVGGGCPDLLVGHSGQTHLIEVKIATGKIRDSQAAFTEGWHGTPVHVVRSVAEALAVIGIRLNE